MAKSRKPQGFTDPLDSIFGVIFGNAKSKPVRIKPRKINGKNTTQEMVRGLAEIAANPANYIAGGATGVVNELANQVNLVEFNYDKFDEDLRKADSSAGRFRVRGGDVGSFLVDPNGFVDSVFEKAKAERNWARYLNLGRGMDSALLAVWAKQQGFSSKESLTLGMASSNWLGVDQKNEGRRKFAENVTMGSILARSGLPSTDARKIPIGVAKDIQKAIDNAKGLDFLKNPGDLDKILNGVSSLKSRSDYSAIVDEIRKSYEKNVKDGNSPYGGKWVTEGTLNRDGYITSLRHNMFNRASLLDIKDPKEMAEYKRLMEAQHALDALYRLKGNGFGDKGLSHTKEKIAKVIESLNKDIAANKADPIKSAQLNSLLGQLTQQFNSANKKEDLIKRVLPWGSMLSGDFSRYKNALITEMDYEIQKAKWALDSASDPLDKIKLGTEFEFLKKKKDSLRTMSGLEWRVLLNDIQGAIGTFQGTSAIGRNLVTGAFFMSQAQGAFAPGDGSAIEISRFKKYLPRYLKDSDPNNPNLKMVQNWSPGLVLPRQGISEGYAALTSLYYFTPNSLAKTFLFNGEGFSYLKYLQRARIARKLNEEGFGTIVLDRLSAAMKSDDKFAGLVDKFLARADDGRGLFSPHDFSANYLTFMESLEGKEGMLGDAWTKLDKIMKNDQNGALNKLITFFGTNQRYFQRFQSLYNEKVKKRVNIFLVNNVFRKWLGDNVANKLIGSGLAKLGIRQMISLAVSEWAAGVGAALGGPIGAVAGAIITALAEGFADKIIKPFIKLFFAFLWAFMVCLIALIVWLTLFIFQAAFPRPQAHIPPTDALECADGNPFADLYDFESQQDPGNLPDPDPNSSCPIHSKSMVCTQGDEAGSSAYHTARNSMDIGLRGLDSPIWYAPADGRVASFKAANNCLDGKNYGGAMIFIDKAGIEYHILHVQALASGAVSKGKPVAIIQTNLDKSWCWTGAHFHLDVKAKGVFVDDTQHWYQEKLKCNIMTYDPTCR